MIFQVIDASDKRLRMWTGSAAYAIRQQDAFERSGRLMSVADYKGRPLTASELDECAASENERLPAGSLADFKRRMKAAARLASH